MENNRVKNLYGFVTNPISVIGLFLVLVEGIAALVVSQSELPYSLNLILVLFIVFFPFAVLWVFYRLVTKHHKKLYSPGDYKDEKNFVSTYNSATQAEELIEVCHQNEDDQLHTNEGMTLDDINLLKEAINSVVAMQKELAKQSEEEETVAIVESVEKDINERLDSYVMEKQFEFRTSVSYIYGSREFVKKLNREGCLAEIYYDVTGKKTPLKKNAEHEAIWLGKKVPLNLAVNIIKMAKNKFPHLKYVKLSSDEAPAYVDYQIFIGGSTNTAVKQGLKALNQNDFERMYECESVEDLHAYILQFAG